MTITVVTMCKMTPIDVRLNSKNFILKSCGVTELLRKFPGGGRILGAREVGLREAFQVIPGHRNPHKRRTMFGGYLFNFSPGM